MHRALVGDFHQLLALLGVQRALHFYHPVELIEHADPGFALGAIFRMNLAVTSVTVTRSSGSALRSAYIRMVIEVQAPRPASTRSYGPGPRIPAAGGDGLVSRQPMRSDRNGLLEFVGAGLANHDLAWRFAGSAAGLGAAGSM